MERIKISNFKGEILMNRRTEMGGVRVERTQYRRWGVSIKRKIGWRLPSKSKWSKEDLSIPAGREEPERCEEVLDND